MGSMGIGLYLVFLVGIFYFMAIRPSQQQKKKQDALISSLAIGDYCVTTAGMYGQIIDITSDMVIVEFGNKNCRIPMLKTAIVSVEKDDAIKTGISEAAKDGVEEQK